MGQWNIHLVDILVVSRCLRGPNPYSSSFLPPGPNPDWSLSSFACCSWITAIVVAAGAESGTFITVVAAFVIHFIAVIVVGQNTCSSRVKLLLSPPSLYFCRTSSLLFSPKILRSELLHGSWMDVGDFNFCECCQDVGIFWMLRRIVELGLSLVSGGMVLSCVVTPALEGVCWK